MTTFRIWNSTRFKSQNYHKIMGFLTDSQVVKKSWIPKVHYICPWKKTIFDILTYRHFTFCRSGTIEMFLVLLFFLINKSAFTELILPVRNMLLTEIYFYVAYKYWVKAVKLWETNFICTSQRVTESVCRSEIACIRSKFAKQN